VLNNRSTAAVPVVRTEPRRAALQRARREQELNRRRQTVRFALRLRIEGADVRRAAESPGIAASTIRSWKPLCREPACPAALRGRPSKNASPDLRRQVLEVLREKGPHAEVPWLRKAFPDVARSELAELKAVDRERRRAGRAEHARRLRWNRAGAVWAIDYTEPPAPVDGRDAAVVSVRDLASGFELAWLPQAAATAAAAGTVLERLFHEHGAPLVLKTDNGSPFTAHATRSLLERYAVTPLYSPAYTPRYNGSCEAGIGGLKSRTHYQADYHGAPDEWTSAHLAAARRTANEEHYPRRLHGRTAAEVWQRRAPITEEVRRRFRDAVDRLRRSVREDFVTAFGNAPSAARQVALERKAVRQALVESGDLTILRSVVTPNINSI
jgi:transposase InsO family protein